MLKSKTEMLNEAIDNIKNKGRCVIGDNQAYDDGCKYWDEAKGYGCAIGNFLKPEYQTDEFAAENENYVNELLIDNSIDILKEEYQTDDEYFLELLQKLHDGASNWVLGEDGLELTPLGILTLDRINAYISRKGEYNNE